ncbi:MAG: hypothetical protein WAS27_02935 [Candidatus Saccharimonadales bacterium]
MIGKLLIGMGIISGVILGALLYMTTPASAGAFGIFAVFVCAYLLTTVCVTFGLWGISRIGIAMNGLLSVQRSAEVMTVRRAYYYSTIVSLAPIIVVSMQSVGGVGVYELLLIALLVLLGCVYVTKRTT